jgi:hypothetical protein
MTNNQAHTKAAETSQTAQIIAYYAGKEAAYRGTPCQFTERELINAWHQGRRDVRGEQALNLDTEWD